MKRWILIGVAIIVTAGGVIVWHVQPAPQPLITVKLDPTDQHPPAFGTNINAVADLLPGQRIAWTLLMQWHPLVRVHLGFRTPHSMELPEWQTNKWDFTQLDALLASLRAKGFTYLLDIRTAPPWMFRPGGQLISIPAFAQYMADLVGWYNQGGFTDATGTYHHSGHYGWVHTWEIWNEPKSSGDIPAPGVNVTQEEYFTPEQYAGLYDQTVNAMLHVDSTIQVGGPALNSFPDDRWSVRFLAEETAPLDFYSFHFYGGTEATEPARNVLDAVTGARLGERLSMIQHALAEYKKDQIPIWIDEVGWNENSLAVRDPRGNAPVATAFISRTLAVAIQHQVQALYQFPLESDAQLGVMDAHTQQIYPSYWFYLALAQAFPSDAWITDVQVTPTYTLIADTTLDGAHHILLANTAVADATKVSDPGVAQTFRLQLPGSSVKIQQFTGQDSMPNVTTQALHAVGTLSIPGYGAVLLTLSRNTVNGDLLTVLLAFTCASLSDDEVLPEQRRRQNPRGRRYASDDTY